MTAPRGSYLVPLLLCATALFTDQLATPLLAQGPSATVILHVLHDSKPLGGALVHAETDTVRTDERGVARVILPAGAHRLVVAKIGFSPDTLLLQVPAGGDTTVTVTLGEIAAEISGILVSTTREQRRVSDTPTRVEVLAHEELEEKTAMSPGNVAALLNETSGVRIQTTAPGLGGANVRVQALRGRYTLLLSDGLPLFGLSTEGLGILQVPPVDLQRVEVIKGAASALYGPTALGGVVNLLSRGPENRREVLLNQTSRGATDAVLWEGFRLGPEWGYTLLAGAHTQRRQDLDGDGWSDLPSYERGVIRPRLYWTSAAGNSVFATVGLMFEDREGGTRADRATTSDVHFPENVETRRDDVGVVGHFLLGRIVTLSIRGSATGQRRAQRFGTIAERDNRASLFAEGALSVAYPTQAITIGAAFQRDAFDEKNFPQLSYTAATPALFAQHTWTPAEWFGLTTSARLDATPFGTFLNPRASMLVHPVHDWALRLSAGTGVFTPTPLVEGTEEISFSRLKALTGLLPEQSRSASAELNGSLSRVELSANLYGSVIDRAVQLRPIPTADNLVELVNVIGLTRTLGAEFFARYRREPFSVTATFAHVKATEPDASAGGRRHVPLTPRNAGGVFVAYEEESGTRVALEGYYTGRQPLEDNPYQVESRPYLLLGVLAQQRVGRVTLFVNGENLGNIRLTQYHPLIRPAIGAGGRWTVDAWAPLDGRVVNIGLKAAVR